MLRHIVYPFKTFYFVLRNSLTFFPSDMILSLLLSFVSSLFCTSERMKFSKWAFSEKHRTSPVEEFHFRTKGVEFEVRWNSIGVDKNPSKISGIPWG